MGTDKKYTENYDEVKTEGFNYGEWNGGTGVAGQTEQLAQNVINMNYDDFTKGNDYQSLVKRYSQNGRKAMDDTLGMAAARTGGLASSYAVAAGNQAYNDHISKLEDAARALYESQRAEAKDNYSIAQGMYDRQYGEWQDKRDFGYGMYRDTVGDAQWKDEQTMKADEHNYTVNQDTQTKAQNEIMAAIEAGQSITDIDPDLITASGYSADYWSNYATIYANGETEGNQETMHDTVAAMIATGKTVEEIKAMYPDTDLATLTGYDENYWSAMETDYANDSQTEPIETNWTPDKVDKWYADRESILADIRSNVAKGGSERSETLEYPTAKMNAEYYAVYGKNVPGYYGEEYKDAYNHIQANLGNTGELGEYISRFYDPDDTTVVDTLCEIVEFFGIDPTSLAISMPKNNNSVSGNPGNGGPIKVPGGFIAIN